MLDINSYRIDWVGALAAGVSAILALLLTKQFFPRSSGGTFYLIAGALTVILSLLLRLLLRYFGI